MNIVDALKDIYDSIRNLVKEKEDEVTYKLLALASKNYVNAPALTADGVQWSDNMDTTTANVDITVFWVKINPPKGGTIVSLELGLTAGFKAVSSATADLIYKWQGKSVAKETWIDLMAATTITNPSTTEQEKSWSGLFPIIQTDLHIVPFEVRLILQCNEANEGRGRVKSSSYIICSYKLS